MPNHPPEEADYTPDKSSWKETRNFHPRDATLGRMGWTILERRGNQEAMWERKKDRIVLTESQALAMIDAMATGKTQEVATGKRIK